MVNNKITCRGLSTCKPAGRSDTTLTIFSQLHKSQWLEIGNTAECHSDSESLTLRLCQSYVYAEVRTNCRRCCSRPVSVSLSKVQAGEKHWENTLLVNFRQDSQFLEFFFPFCFICFAFLLTFQRKNSNPSHTILNPPENTVQ